MARKKRHQPKVDGGRDALATCVIPNISMALKKIAARYGVGVSWVLAVIAGKELGIDVPTYEDDGRKGYHDKRSR